MVGGWVLSIAKPAGALALAAVLLSGCHWHRSDSSAPAPSGTSGTGTATLSWEAPTTNTDGSALIDLSGYRIYYGMSSADLSQTVQLGLGTQTYVIENLGTGTWYFAIRAVTNTGLESALSQVVSKTI